MTRLSSTVGVLFVLAAVANQASVTSAKEKTPYRCALSADEKSYDLIPIAQPGPKENKFPCVSITNKQPPRTALAVLHDKSYSGDKLLTADVCSLEQKKEHTSFVLEKDPDMQVVWTGLYCKYECSASHLRCIEAPAANDSECPCRSTGLQAALVAHDSPNNVKDIVMNAAEYEETKNNLVYIQSATGSAHPIEKTEEANPCTGLEVDYAFTTGPYAERVPCMVFKGSTPKRDTLVAKAYELYGKKFEKCSAVSKEETHYETYVKSESDTTTMLCAYGCKPSYRYECKPYEQMPTSDTPESTCLCEKKGGNRLKLMFVTSEDQVEVVENQYRPGQFGPELPNQMRQLVQKDDEVLIGGTGDSATCTVDSAGKDDCIGCAKCMEGRCVPNDCGACGKCEDRKCVERDCGVCGKCEEGKCILKQSNPEKSLFCPCGKLCPPSNAIETRQNNVLTPIDCHSNPLMTGLPCIKHVGESQGSGDTIPDLCLKSAESDVTDKCSCAKTHKEIIPELSEVPKSGSTPVCVPL